MKEDKYTKRLAKTQVCADMLLHHSPTAVQENRLIDVTFVSVSYRC